MKVKFFRSWDVRMSQTVRGGVSSSVYDIDKEAGNEEISWRNPLGVSGHMAEKGFCHGG